MILRIAQQPRRADVLNAVAPPLSYEVPHACAETRVVSYGCGSIRTAIAGSWRVLKPRRVVVFGLRIHIGSLSCPALFPIRLNRSRIDIDVTARILSFDPDQFSTLKKMANVRPADEEKFRCFFNGHDSHFCVIFSPHGQKRRAQPVVAAQGRHRRQQLVFAPHLQQVDAHVGLRAVACYRSSRTRSRSISQSVSTTLVHPLPSMARLMRRSVTSREFWGNFAASLSAFGINCCARSSHTSHR